MNDDKVVFRTTHPEVLTAFKQAVDAYDKWGKRIRAFAKEVHPDAKPMVSEAWGDRQLGGISMVEPIPDGWRIDNNKAGYPRYLVPRRSVKAGKEWAKRLDELRNAPSIRSALPGMPSNVVSGISLLNPGLEERNGVLYATWAEDPRRSKADTGFSKTDTVEESIWEQVKLSEYYAIKESEEVSE
jgi:hypothetical protein